MALQNNALQLNQFDEFKAKTQKELEWEINWQDFGISVEQLTAMGPHQRINHFLGMYNISRKNTLGIHLKRFKKEFPEYYNFFPQTWLYPSDFHDIQDYWQRKLAIRKEEVENGIMTAEQSLADPKVLFIAKPEAGAQGRGIFLAKSLDHLRTQIDERFRKQMKEFEDYLRLEEQYDTAQNYSHCTTAASSNISGKNEEKRGVEAPAYFAKENTYVVQKYIKHVALWKGHKFDFRIYVLVTSVIDPMTIFLYKDGLVRLASEKYDPNKNLHDSFIHLTNYSLNKNNNKYDGDQHKLKLSDVLTGILTQPPVKKGKPGVTRSSKEIWAEIEEIVVKTIITVQPQLQHIYRSCQTKEPDCCFELLGFDIMLDQKLKPWMLEVNHTPSFGVDTKIDLEVKNQLLKNTLEVIQLNIETRKKIGYEMKQEMKQQAILNQYKRLSAKEHSDRVRFNPELVDGIPGNRYKLIYPKEAPGPDPELYLKFQKRADEIWKAATGTFINEKARRGDRDFPEEKKKKKKKKKKVKPQEPEPINGETTNKADNQTEISKITSLSNLHAINGEKVEEKTEIQRSRSQFPDELIESLSTNGHQNNSLTRSVIVKRPESREERLETNEDSSLAFNFVDTKKKTVQNFYGGDRNNKVNVTNNIPENQMPNYQRPLRKQSAFNQNEQEVVACSQCGQTSTNVKTLRRQSSQLNQQPPQNREPQQYFNICSTCLLASGHNSKSLNMRTVGNIIYHNSQDYKLNVLQPTKSSQAKQVQNGQRNKPVTTNFNQLKLGPESIQYQQMLGSMIGNLASLNNNNISYSQIDKSFLYEMQKQQKNMLTQNFDKQPQQWLFDKNLPNIQNEPDLNFHEKDQKTIHEIFNSMSQDEQSAM